MGKWIALAFAIVAAPGSAPAHHGGAPDIAIGIGIGAGAVAIAIVVVFLSVRSRSRHRGARG